MDCIENLGACHAECCKHLHFKGEGVLVGPYLLFDVPLKPDDRRYIELHGAFTNANLVTVPFRNTRLEDGDTVVDMVCLALSEHGRCNVYNERPRVCRDMVPGADGYWIPEGCVCR